MHFNQWLPGRFTKMCVQILNIFISSLTSTNYTHYDVLSKLAMA